MGEEMKLNKKLKIIIVLLSVALLLGGCTKENKKEENIDAVLVLDWVVNTNHTGIFVAQELGYFNDEGINLEIIQAPEMNFIEMVGINTAQIGICGQEQMTQARMSSGKVPVVGIGTILQHNTSGFAAPVGRGIKSPKDFEGKRYSGWGTMLEEKFIENLMEKDDGDFSKVQMRMMLATDYFASMETEADFAWIYYGWDGVGAQIRQYPINFILLQDIYPEMDFYSPLFISNETTIKNNPDLITKFMKAVSKGYKYTVKNPEEACDLLLKSAPETSKDHALASIKYLSEYFLDQSGNFGTMNDNILNNFSDWMYENELISNPLDVKEAFTDKFLP